MEKFRLGQQVFYIYKRIREGKPNKQNNQQSNQSTTQNECQSSTNPSFSTRFQQIQAFQQAFNNLSNFSTLFPGFSQVSKKFPAVLFHLFIAKSNIFSSNSSILVASSIQVFIKLSSTILFLQSNPMFTSSISTFWLQVSFKSINFHNHVISFILKEI